MSDALLPTSWRPLAVADPGHADKRQDSGSSERLWRAEPQTIVLIHGLWMTPHSWEPFRQFCEERRYRVLAPPWPRLQGSVEDVRRDPSALAGLGLAEIVDHYANAIRLLDEAPILIGHSLGGLVVQILLDRGLGAAGIAIDSAPPKGVWRLPPSQVRALLPVLSNPLSYRQTVSLTYGQFRYAFANTMSEGKARAAFTHYAIPAPGRPVFEAKFANLNPWSATAVNYANGERAPLLLIAGTDDHTAPRPSSGPTTICTGARRRSRASRNFRIVRI
jgi:pimeloyl-ACP methyl ester carboxylesterase